VIIQESEENGDAIAFFLILYIIKQTFILVFSMRTDIATIIFISLYSFVFGQTSREGGNLIEYLQSDTSEIVANIFIPSFSSDSSADRPQIIISKKNALMVDLTYVNRNKANGVNSRDTCYIATYDIVKWGDTDPKFAESPCIDDNNYCGIIITSAGQFMIRFRIGSRLRFYSLTVKD